MSYLLAIDIGNTNITAGVFKGSRLAGKAKIPTHSPSLYDRNIKKLLGRTTRDPKKAQEVIISSVVPLALSRFVMHINNIMKCKISIIGKDAKVPIRNMYRRKGEVGQDRLVNAFCAKALYGAPSVIIDFGTAITFDVVSRRGDYLGGLIVPGIELGLESLYKRTALLPKVELKRASHIIGKDTVNSMRGGILFGYGAMCDGLVLKYRKILGNSLTVIATGGNAKIMKRYASSIQIVDEELTLKGLYLMARRFE